MQSYSDWLHVQLNIGGSAIIRKTRSANTGNHLPVHTIGTFTVQKRDQVKS